VENDGNAAFVLANWGSRYLGLGVVGLGAVYAMFSSKPKKVAGQAKQQVSEEVARQRAAR
jgi:hypothetical protein